MRAKGSDKREESDESGERKGGKKSWSSHKQQQQQEDDDAEDGGADAVVRKLKLTWLAFRRWRRMRKEESGIRETEERLPLPLFLINLLLD